MINNNSNSSNGRITTVSIKDFEQQVVNARRETEALKHRLKAVIKKNTYHL